MENCPSTGLGFRPDADKAPPTLIHVGSDEVLRDDAVRMADRFHTAGGHVQLEIWPRMPHVWHVFAPMLPEACRAIRQIGEFLDGVLVHAAQAKKKAAV